jgi:hypothetical protein
VPKIVFLSRGHGFGHAARDLLILDALRALRPDAELVLASSGSGYEYFRRRSVPCVDLGIPDQTDTSEDAGKAVFAFLGGQGEIDLVLTDEVMWALPICRKVLGVECVLITDWFYAELDLPHLDVTMNQAAAVVVTDFAAAHPAPASVSVPIHFTSPLVKTFPTNRDDLRAELGAKPDELTAVVTLGGMPDRPEARRIAELALDSWATHAPPGAGLHLLATAPPAATAAPNVTWHGVSTAPERFYRAADLVIADAAGFTVCELARSQVPTVAVMIGGLSAAIRLRLDRLAADGSVVTISSVSTPEELWRAADQVRGQAGALSPSIAWADAADVAALCLRYLP